MMPSIQFYMRILVYFKGTMFVNQMSPGGPKSCHIRCFIREFQRDLFKVNLVI